MCGIAGMLTADPAAAPDDEAVKRMCGAIVHRGPDDHGYLTHGPCSLGHRRLSISDLRPEGAQPSSKRRISRPAASPPSSPSSTRNRALGCA